MSDWIETLDARRNGEVEGFHDVNSPIDKLDDTEIPTTATLSPESDAPQPPALPVDAPTGGRRTTSTRSASTRSAGKRSSSSKK